MLVNLNVYLAAGGAGRDGGGDDFFGLSLWQGIVGGIILVLVEEAVRRWAIPAVERHLKARREHAPAKLLLGFLTHVEAIGHQMAAHPAPDEIPTLIRNDVLEPIRNFIPTEAAEQIKVVWFRPEGDDTLVAHAQVGYTDHEASRIRLPGRTGIAWRAFKEQKAVAIPDTLTEKNFVPIDGVDDQGSLLCVPIERSGKPTGVLSVLSTRRNAFKPAYRKYLQALAAMIAAAEALEEHSRSKQTPH